MTHGKGRRKKKESHRKIASHRITLIISVLSPEARANKMHVFFDSCSR